MNLLDKNALAEQLNCSVRTIEDWVKKRRIPYRKINGLVRFHPDDIARWMDKKKVQPVSPTWTE